jgi:D-sedoheptulose 7-phosphate isomerase
VTQSEQTINQLFQGSIDTTMQANQELTPLIAHCSELLVQCLLSEHKILCCGEASNAALAQIFTSHLLNRFDYERPGLPAISLSSDATTLSALCSDNSFNEVFSKQIRALGQSGDILLVLSNSDRPGTTVQAIQAAHDREMIVVSISDSDSQDISSLMLPEDIALIIPSNKRPRVAETQLLIIHCLCALIDQQLFGTED